MKREIRLKNQKIDEVDSIKILETAFYGVLSTTSEDGMPYGVPMNYVYSNNKIYFHCAVEGHKLDNIRHNPKASFTVVGKTKMLPQRYTAQFESVIAFGTICVVEDPMEVAKSVRLLCEKNMPEHLQMVDKVIAANLLNLKALEMSIEYFTGKASED